ncbi:Zinc transporter 1 [Clonorchis sinensis]|uniref:Zinc transporter 1 n=2 Tax=Clonorchis sinensis TaxID=79923 RepID=A0A8T1MQQ4_CLOSI|nr:Zinc transporter 1 [Clonorchis sinensis]GAA34451.2 solute carrier family 30 (zinc transporter) member 1 [Clonorchis sinensis]
MVCKSCGNSVRLSSMLFLVAAYFLVELIVGYVIKSVALVADAFHMLSDLIALIIGIIATRIAKWPSSSKNTFGWQRAEVMGGLINTVMLSTFCISILMEAIQRFVKPELIDSPRLMIYVGAGGLLVNILGLIVLGTHSHDNHSGTIEVMDTDVPESSPSNTGLRPMSDSNFYSQTRNIDGSLVLDGKVAPLYTSEMERLANDVNGPSQINNTAKASEEKPKKIKQRGSMNMRAVFLHVLSDFFGSIIVVASAAILEFAPGKPDEGAAWKLYIDPAMSVVMVLIILSSAVPLMYRAALILLQSVPNEISLKNLKNRLENIDGIHKVHDLHVWRLQSNCIIGTVHIRCVSLPDYLNIARKVKELFHEFNIHCTTIQPEFEEGAEDDVRGDIDYQTCVLDCGPNTNCQSDTCCPAPNSACNTAALSSGSSNKSSPGVPAPIDSLQSAQNGPSVNAQSPTDVDEVRIRISSVTNHTDKSVLTPNI